MVEGQALADLVSRLIGCIKKRDLAMYGGRVGTTRLTRTQFETKFRALDRAMETLVGVLESGESEEVRRQAAWSLKRIGTPRCTRYLECKPRKYDFVGGCAALALGADHSPLAKEILDLIPDTHD